MSHVHHMKFTGHFDHLGYIIYYSYSVFSYLGVSSKNNKSGQQVILQLRKLSHTSIYPYSYMLAIF